MKMISKYEILFLILLGSSPFFFQISILIDSKMPHEASQETSIPHVQLKLAPFSQFFGIFQNYPSICYIPLFRNQRVRKIINPKLNFNSHESENLNFENSIPLFTGKYLQSKRGDAMHHATVYFQVPNALVLKQTNIGNKVHFWTHE